MKAADILMWLLVFNLVLWLLGGIGFNLYNLSDYKTSVETDSLNQSNPIQTTKEIKSRADQFIWDVARTTISGIVGAIVGAAIIGYLLQAKTSSQGIVYGFFAGVFWDSYGKTVQVFYSIFNVMAMDNGVQLTLFMTVFIIFTAISVWVFAFGIMQMVTGGWRFFK